MIRKDITTKGWDTYTLLDSGEGRKLEQWGTVITDRPDPQALWSKKHPFLWKEAHAQFTWAQAGERWKIALDIPETWTIKRLLQKSEFVLELSFKGFKHIGIFPEHEHQWESVYALGQKHRGLRMLNLFGYTGAASVAGALAGMKVTHIDASHTTIATVKKNMQLSHVPPDSVRTVCEDALKYVKRLIARKEHFEIIIMDPPVFGRGPKGEVWKIEGMLLELLSLMPQLLSEDAELVILNGYASTYSACTFGELLKESLNYARGTYSYGEVGIVQKDDERTLTTGMYAQWKK